MQPRATRPQRSRPCPLSFAARARVLGGATALLLGCGASPPPAAVTTVATPTGRGAAAPRIPEDRSPVEGLEGLIVQGHVESPARVLQAVRGYIPTLPALDAHELLGAALGSQVLARLVDPEKAVDVAVGLRPGQGREKFSKGEPVAAFALSMLDDLDLATALQGAFTTEVGPGGVKKLVPASSSSSGARRAAQGDCVVAPSLGASRHRLVCAFGHGKGADLEALTPWLARGVTRQPPRGHGMQASVELATIRKAFPETIDRARDQARALVGPEIKTGFPSVDVVLRKGARDIVDDSFAILEDLEGISLDVDVPPDGMRVGGSISFGGSTSWAAKVLLAGADSAGPPPGPFGRLPGDGAWLASFARSSPATEQLLQPWQQFMLSLAGAVADDMKWSKKDRDAALEVVRLMFPRAADAVAIVGGSIKPNAKGSAEAPSDEGAWMGREIGKALRHSAARSSWSISAVERDAKGAIELAKAVATVASSPSLAASVKKLSRDRIAWKVAVHAAAAKDLPKGAYAQTYELTVSKIPGPADASAIDKSKAKDGRGGAAKPEPVKLTGDLVIVPEGTTRTWTAWGHNVPTNDLVARLKGAMAGNASPSVSQLPGYDFLARGASTWGAVISLDGVAKAFVPDQAKANEILSQLPDHGRGGVAMRGGASHSPRGGGGGAGGTGEVTVFVPRDVIAAIGAAATAMH